MPGAPEAELPYLDYSKTDQRLCCKRVSCPVLPSFTALIAHLKAEHPEDPPNPDRMRPEGVECWIGACPPQLPLSLAEWGEGLDKLLAEPLFWRQREGQGVVDANEL